MNFFVRGRAVHRSPSGLYISDAGVDTPYFILPITVGEDRLVLVAGQTDAATWNGLAWTEVTPIAGDFTGSFRHRWTGGVFHGVPVMSNGFDPPVGLTGSNFEALDWDTSSTWADKGYTSLCLRPYKNMLVSLGWDDGVDTFRQTVLWSTVADPNTLPISWEFSDLTNFAGYQPLAERDGDLVDGVGLRDSLIVYAQGAIYRMTFVPQDVQQIMNFTNVSLAQGMLAKHCAVELDGRHVVLANDDVIMHDGMTITSIIEQRRRAALFSRISTGFYDRCQVVLIRSREEVWICIPATESISGELTEAHVWNWRDDAWSVRELPPGTRFISDAVIPVEYGNDLWGLDEESWLADTTTWGGGFYAPQSRKVFSVNDAYDTVSASLVQMDGSYSDALGVEQGASYVSREGIVLSGSPDRRRMVVAVELDLDGGTATVEVGASEAPDGPYTYVTAGVWTPGTTRDLPVRGPSGFYHAIRVTFNEKADTRLSQYRLRYIEQGLR